MLAQQASGSEDLERGWGILFSYYSMLNQEALSLWPSQGPAGALGIEFHLAELFLAAMMLNVPLLPNVVSMGL